MTQTQTKAHPTPWPQTLVGAGVVATALALALGALSIPSDAGYGGIGPNVLPWVCALALALCGLWILWEARTGGFRQMDEVQSEAAYWPAFVWVSAGLLANAALITTLGFIFSCTLCYLLAMQGLRRAAGQAHAYAARTWLVDTFTGMAIAAPVFWMFTQFLSINLPGLTPSGWL
jgi:putative tricarboxylic transport membrane protein